MSKHFDYSDYDSYYEDYDNSSRHHSGKQKNKFKGHQSKRGRDAKWDSVLAEVDIQETSEEVYVPSPAPVVETPNKTTIVWGPNTHTIRNNQIDFDRVADISKVEGDYNGRHTFGILFIFNNKKRSSRTVWFGTNERERDAMYNKEYSFWKTLSK